MNYAFDSGSREQRSKKKRSTGWLFFHGRNMVINFKTFLTTIAFGMSRDHKRNEALFTITAEIHGSSWLIFTVNNTTNNYNNNFIYPAKMNQLVNRWTHTWIYNLHDALTRESGQFDNLLSWKTNWCRFLMRLSCYWQ